MARAGEFMVGIFLFLIIMTGLFYVISNGANEVGLEINDNESTELLEQFNESMSSFVSNSQNIETDMEGGEGLDTNNNNDVSFVKSSATALKRFFTIPEIINNLILLVSARMGINQFITKGLIGLIIIVFVIAMISAFTKRDI